MPEKIKSFCEEYGLDTVISEITIVTGGLLHKMYHVVTKQGEYAVKVLNPDIMRRPEALNNMVNSEKIAHVLKKQLPLVCAKELKGRYVNEYMDNYYIVYDWIYGASVFAPKISAMHCEKIGRLLGQMHAADIVVEGVIEKDSRTEGMSTEAAQAEEVATEAAQAEALATEVSQPELFPWDSYLAEAKKQNASWLSVYEGVFPQIKQWNVQCVESSKKLSDYQVLSHRDLDPKNVMWQEDEPVLIDWEAAGYVNPYQELVEVLNYWAVDETGSYDKEKLEALLKAYRESMSTENVDWAAVLSAGYEGMLGWLEYNVKRALRLEGTSKKDVEQGTWQILSTIKELQQYQQNVEILQEWLCNEK